MRFRPDIPYDLPAFPPKGVDLSRTAFAEQLLPARVALAELKGYSELLPNPLILLSPAIFDLRGFACKVQIFENLAAKAKE